jgi:hypothetical protein
MVHAYASEVVASARLKSIKIAVSTFQFSCRELASRIDSNCTPENGVVNDIIRIYISLFAFECIIDKLNKVL